MTTALRNRKGFTLIEVLVAIAILTISMLAILEAVVITMEHNLNNVSRDESVRIAEAKMNELRNTTFASLVSGAGTVTRNFRNLTRTFTVQWTVNNLSANSIAIVVMVTWTHKGVQHTHSVTSMVSTDV
ncbi:MAG TPA: prepilin-type N-terminal cleavage/methylation domain-containing protein [Syntrophorhabdaceae bacterium]|nr:prepilin-type N-terminal cleavage/methylation domain-containing protein [Syntrophorhabdaceae bacterium]HQM80395.1 prepilin-type N-terminal cleavage/methylation domain-containing protein [Syntrophorhabdaceae bacterium]